MPEEPTITQRYELLTESDVQREFWQFIIAICMRGGLVVLTEDAISWEPASTHVRHTWWV